MKKIIISFALVFPLSLFSQRHSLSVKTDDKITIHGFSYWQELRVKSKDTSFTYRLHQGNPDVIKNLKAGTYELTALSLFNHKITKKTSVPVKTATVAVKGLQKFYTRVPETQCLSQKLKMGDTLYILFNSTADENVKEKIAVTKNKEGYKAIQYQGIGHEIFQQMQFKDAAFASVINFEKDGKKANSPKAETAPKAEVYTIELNKEIISFIVPGEWHGLDKLKAVLFIVEQK